MFFLFLPVSFHWGSQETAETFCVSSSYEKTTLSMVLYTPCQSPSCFHILHAGPIHELQEGTLSRCLHLSKWQKLPVVAFFFSLLSSLVSPSPIKLIFWIYLCLKIHKMFSIFFNWTFHKNLLFERWRNQAQKKNVWKVTSFSRIYFSWLWKKQPKQNGGGALSLKSLA